MPNQVRALVVLDGEGEQLQGPAGGPATVKARAETANGTFTALENIIAPWQGPARLLGMFNPASMERFFEGTAKLPPRPAGAGRPGRTRPTA